MESEAESEEMETLWFCCAYVSPYDSDFLFSQGHKRSYNSDSDSIASENQPSREFGERSKNLPF